MIESGSARRYLLYAIGEIGLVVIGILIALQINNWNEDQNKKAQIKTYLNNLISALNEDIVYLNYTISGNSFRASCIKEILLWSTGKTPKDFPKLVYKIDDNWDPGELRVGWSNMWMDSMPKEYDRSFVDECFLRTEYGNIIVVNQSAFEEFKNTGLFSHIENEELKNQINDYYSSMNWNFSNWRETSFRQDIDEWVIFLRKDYQTNLTDLTHIENPIDFIRNHRDIQLELEALGRAAGGRVKQAGRVRESAKDLVNSIEQYIQQL